MFPAQAGKPAISEITGGHLYAHPVLPCIFLSIKVSHMADYTMLICPGTHKSFIPVAFLSSEMKVAMGKCNGVRAIFPEKKICHAHGIDSPADCQQSPGPS